MATPEPEHYTLLTNIDFAHIKEPNLRLECHAILIETNQRSFLGDSKQHRIRAFGTSGDWPVFTYWLKEAPKFELIQADSANNMSMLTHKGEMKPVYSGTVLKFENGPEFFLQASRTDHPIDVYEQDDDILLIWKILAEKVRMFWDMPNMPRLQWGTP